MSKPSQPSRLAVVRVAMWLALMVLAVGVALLVGHVLGLAPGIGAGLVTAGLSSAAVVFFLVDADPPAGSGRR